MIEGHDSDTRLLISFLVNAYAIFWSEIVFAGTLTI